MAEAEKQEGPTRAQRQAARLLKVVSRNLKAAREAKRLSQHALSRKTGLSVSYISMLERTMRTPSLEAVCAIGVATGKSFVELWTPPEKSAPAPEVEQVTQ